MPRNYDAGNEAIVSSATNYYFRVMQHPCCYVLLEGEDAYFVGVHSTFRGLKAQMNCEKEGP